MYEGRKQQNVKHKNSCSDPVGSKSWSSCVLHGLVADAALTELVNQCTRFRGSVVLGEAASSSQVEKNRFSVQDLGLSQVTSIFFRGFGSIEGCNFSTATNLRRLVIIGEIEGGTSMNVADSCFLT
eukprot:gb/GECG01004823.1/.p1 GENE.gb/GECG01004823.1/~~gb/GECG01004823.1/.p1  ORF type:complete len:126 (+),score=6.09 gb/GECG01004823.1/:1-378(+)